MNPADERTEMYAKQSEILDVLYLFTVPTWACRAQEGFMWKVTASAKGLLTRVCWCLPSE